MESSHMQLQDTDCVRARMKYTTAACQPQRLRGRVEDEGGPEDESEAHSRVSLSRRFTAVDARLLELATLHWAKWCNDPRCRYLCMIGPACDLPGCCSSLLLTLLCVIQALRQIPEEDGGGKEGGGPGGMG